HLPGEYRWTRKWTRRSTAAEGPANACTGVRRGHTPGGPRGGGDAPDPTPGAAGPNALAVPAVSALRHRCPWTASWPDRPLGLAPQRGRGRRPRRGRLAVDPGVPAGAPLAGRGRVRGPRAPAVRGHGLLPGGRRRPGGHGPVLPRPLWVLGPRAVRHPDVLRRLPWCPGALATVGARGRLARPGRGHSRAARRARRPKAPPAR